MTMRHKNIEYHLYNFHILPFRHQSQAERLQAVQHRAINIILSFLEQPLMFLYVGSAWLAAGTLSLQARRLDHSKLFFQKHLPNR